MIVFKANQSQLRNKYLLTGVDENVVNVVEGVADAVENQADAGRDATFADRLQMAGIISITGTLRCIRTC